MGWKYSIDLSSGKGYEYYTGLIFHLYAGQEIIGGGGRYDDLIPMMGGDRIPAAGFALYIDRLMALMGKCDKTGAGAKKILLNARADALPEALDIAGKLRNSGYMVVTGFGTEASGGFAYVLEVKSPKPGYLLTNVKTGKTASFDSDGEVMAALGCR